ncbi:uncharacterized protein N7459_001985 [Penicillium hispanicum]|uniref:uncharacterized protein n=1 Tax=Penicillium hispanicum TaxID=1080232 RepID=UPI0025406EB6|nr:uncharacterized protein N7459_001985 [Penicillium hispanicum]KAJ5591616.1 hypothetical protein N7459_001985 [Penicillium hispanicum]
MSTAKGCRDRNKATGQPIALGGSPKAIRPGSQSPEPESPLVVTNPGRSFNLVICGATELKDGWLWASFMGFCKAWMDRGVMGEFWSCFPVLAHLCQLKNNFRPGIDDIKFGQYGANKDHLFSYSRVQYCQQPHWWTDIDADDLKQEVETWIQAKTYEAKAGDVVNIVILAHGSTNGKIQLGANLMNGRDLVRLVGGFADGVAVTVTSNTCYSECLVNSFKASKQKDRYISAACSRDQKAFSMSTSSSGRIRNGRFANAFVLSLQNLTPPNPQAMQWQVEQHEDFVREQMRNVTPGAMITEPQFYSQIPLTTLVGDLFFRPSDSQAVVPSASTTAHPQRIDWTETNALIHEIIQRGAVIPSSALPATVVTAVSSEASLCNTNTTDPSEIPVCASLHCNEPPWCIILANLYWRSVRQAAVWDIFKLLRDANLVQTASLCVPIDLQSPTPDTGTMVRLLDCFTSIASDIERVMQSKIPVQSTEWNADIEWLATVIVRSGKNIPEIIKTIHNSRILGPFDEEEYENFREMEPEPRLVQDARDREGKPTVDGHAAPNDNVFGFWLPHGLSEDPAIAEEQQKHCFERAKMIEDAYKKVVEDLPIGVLVLEIEEV